MKTTIRTFILLIPFLTFSLFAQEKVNTQTTQKKLTALSVSIAKLKKKIQLQKQKEAQTRQELEDTHQKLVKTTQVLGSLTKNLETKKRKVEQLTHQIQTLAEKHAYSKQILEKVLQLQFEIHEQKNNNPFSHLNDQFTTQAPLYLYYTQAQEAYIKQLIQQLHNYKNLEHRAEQEKVALRHLQSEVIEQTNELQKKQNQTQKILPRISQQHNLSLAQLQNKIEEQKQLENLLKKLRAQMVARPAPKFNSRHPFAQALGKLSLPIHQKNARLTRNAQSKFIIPTQQGTEVHAIYPGRIIFAEFLRGLKMLIIIDHGGGFMSLYGNNEVLLKKTGDWVNVHEKIAIVGENYGKQNAGLYFELRKDGQALDLFKWIQRA